MLRSLALFTASLTAAPAAAQELAAVTWPGTIVRLDAVTGAVIHSTSLAPALDEVNAAARTPDGTWWVSADRGARLVEVDPSTATLGASVTVNVDSRGLAVHPITGELYSLQISGALDIIDTTTGAATRVADVDGGGYQSLAFRSDGTLWAWCITQTSVQNGLWQIDPVTGARLLHVMDPSGTLDRHQFLAPMPDGRFLTGQDDLYVVDPETGSEAFVASPGFDIRGADVVLDRALGTTFCDPANTNSAGLPARMVLAGDGLVATNQLLLGCVDLPASSFGYFITSDTVDFVANPAGSQGNLCLGGSIGRLSTQIVDSGAAGWVATTIDLTQVPSPTGPVPITAGETRHFSYWYRDANPDVTSNFADGRTVTFQ